MTNADSTVKTTPASHASTTGDCATPNPDPPPRAERPPTPDLWSRYVAIGDSFTEGLWDIDPHNPKQCRGWADLLAHTLTRRRIDAGTEPLQYANLAIRGRLMHSIVTGQLPVALEMKPDLISVLGGGNDILRPAADIDRMARNIEDAVVRIRATGADVLLCTGIDARDSPLVRRTRGRTAILNSHIWTIARRHGAYVLDLWGMQSLRDWRMWSDDRIHLTAEGHHRVSQAALVALGQSPDDERWDEPRTALPPASRTERARENARWLGKHVGPWATRRLTGRSSGDNRTAKYPELQPLW